LYPSGPSSSFWSSLPQPTSLQPSSTIPYPSVDHFPSHSPCPKSATMDSVATIERQTPRNGVYPSRRTDSRRCSPRLPTPETSWSSKGSLDEQIPRMYARQGPQIHALLSQNGPEHDSISTERANERNMRRDSRHHPVPQSPPYQPADVHRPSLPPLKTVRFTEVTIRAISDR